MLQLKGTRLIAVAAAIVAIVALVGLAATASAQQEPPFRFYGTGLEAGDKVGATDQYGNDLGMAVADDDGSWHLDVDRDNNEGVSFTLNGEPTEVQQRSTGAGQADVTLTAISVNGDGDDDTLSEDDELLMSEDEAPGQEEEVGFPNTGSGGLGGVSSAVLAGVLLAVLATVALGGWSYRRYVSVAKR